jgi:hypothetical protein
VEHRAHRLEGFAVVREFDQHAVVVSSNRDTFRVRK